MTTSPETHLDPEQHSTLHRTVAAVVAPVPFWSVNEPNLRDSRFWVRIAAMLAITIVAYLPNLLANSGEQAVNEIRSRSLTQDISLDQLLPLPRNFHWQPALPAPLPRMLMHVEEWNGAGVRAHRSTGLAIHLVSCVLLWFILRRLGSPAAWLGAAAFAVHPGAVAAVTKLDQHGRLWAAMFSLAAVLSLLWVFGISPTEVDDGFAPQSLDPWETEAYGNSNRFWQAAGVVAIYLFALLSTWIAALCQPTSAIAVGLCVLLLVTWRKRSTRRRVWRTLLLLIPFVGLALIVTLGCAGDVQTYRAIAGPQNSTTLASRTIQIAGWGLRWIVIPYPLIAQSELTKALLGTAAFSIGITLIVATIAFLIFRRRSAGWLIATSCCYLLLLPSLFAPPAIYRAAAIATPGGDGENYFAAIPIIAMLTGIAVVAARYPRSVHGKVASRFAAGVLIIAVLSSLTAIDAYQFSSPEHLFRAAVASNVNSGAARAKLGSFLIHQGRYDEAAEALGRRKPADCTDLSLAITEGDLLRVEQRPGAAVAWYERAAGIDPSDPQVPERLASTEAELGQSDDALKTFKHGIVNHPSDVILKNEFGLFLAKSGDLAGASEQFHAAITAEPDFAAAHVNLASVLLQQSKLDDAADQLQIAVRLDPQNFDAYHNAGVVLVELHSYDTAIQMLNYAAQLRPDSPEAHNDLAVALSSGGKYKQAVAEFERAVRLRPTYAAAQRNLEITKQKAAAEPDQY